MVNKNELSLGEILVQNKIIERSSLNRALKEQEKKNESLLNTLLKLKLAPEDKILTAWANRLTLPLLKLRDLKIDKKMVAKIPVRFVAHYKFMPVQLENKTLTIVVSTPLDIRMLDEIRLNLGYEIKTALTSREELSGAIKKHYGLAADTIERILTQSGLGDSKMMTAIEPADEKIEDIEQLAGDASIIKLVNQIIMEGHKSRATDIHLEPYRGRLRLRYRIDGILYDTNVPPAIKNFYGSIISRIKIMSNLNIVERRLPQDGRCVVNVERETLDLRISIMPTPHGESVVIRILPTQRLYLLADLGLSDSNITLLESLIKRPHGILFVTGPTGSGKTTTLYACLHQLNTDKTKIITVENPIEYEMAGITQINVLPEIDLTFARALRSILRHDPDIMMVGEVRDLETAEITIRSALTGHLIFSTIHTNDAAGGITRLIDIGIEPYLVASSVESFIAQRLVRIICPECKEENPNYPAEVKDELMQALHTTGKSNAKPTIYKGRGCEACNFTGYQGRTAIYEILIMDEKIRKQVLTKASSEGIKKVALESGMIPLRQDGWLKVIKGITTPEEVMRVTPTKETTLVG